MKGAYILVSYLKNDSNIRIGEFGTIDFKKGYYCYVGSANGKSVNIESRTYRHKRLVSEKTGKLWWHIDYFLVNPDVSLLNIIKFENREECKISKFLEISADRTIHGFGSSDCKSGCVGHLHYFKGKRAVIKLVKRI